MKYNCETIFNTIIKIFHDLSSSIYVVNFLDFNQLSALASMKNVKRVKKLGRCVKSMCNLSIQTSDILNVRYFPFALAFVKSYWLNR